VTSPNPQKRKTLVSLDETIIKQKRPTKD
jgi:hypothetical protein